MNYDQENNFSRDINENPENGYRGPVAENNERNAAENVPEQTASAPEERMAESQVPAAEERYAEQPRLWSEPSFESAETAPNNVYSPNHHNVNSGYVPPSPPKKEKKKGGRRILKTVCLILVCSLLSSGATFFVADYLIDKKLESVDIKNQVNLGNAGISEQKQENTGDEPENTPGTSVSYTGDELTAEEIYELATTQVVGVNTSYTTNIFGMSSSSAVAGTGFIISEDGYILTNYHVISYAELYSGDVTVMTYDGKEYEAEIVGYNEDNDIAVLKIDETGLNAVTFGNSDDMQVGEMVYAVGNPLGELAFSMTDGIVSALDRVITTGDSTTGSSTSMNMFQISAAVNSGNSGGPVYNARGEVIGVVTAKYSDTGVEGLGFAIPINDAINISTQLIETGYVAGAYIGATVTDITEVYSSFVIEYYNFPTGVCIISVGEGSGSEKAGIQVGDIIVEMNGEAISTVDELKLRLRSHTAGDRVRFRIYRMSANLSEGEYLEVYVTLDSQQTATEPETSSGSGSGGGNNSGGSYPGYNYPYPGYGYGY